jgi:transaldolase
MANKLEQLKMMTDVVADTGDIEAMKQFKPQDATTNPSLLLKAAAMPQYSPLVAKAKAYGNTRGQSDQERLDLACDRLAVLVGTEILNLIPGRISTEVDARLSFNTPAMVERGRALINQYEELGYERSRILIKLASTWEGIRAAEILESEAINCNLTLLFSFEQAVACANAGVYLISPFVGRILDWWKSNSDIVYTAENDPGVLSVQKIFNYYKSNKFNTVVMGASFRNTGEIEALAGCDRLTISPALLAELSQDEGQIFQTLDKHSPPPAESKLSFDESTFRWMLNEDAMATEKLAEGIRQFAKDTLLLEQQLKA